MLFYPNIFPHMTKRYYRGVAHLHHCSHQVNSTITASKKPCLYCDQTYTISLTFQPKADSTVRLLHRTAKYNLSPIQNKFIRTTDHCHEMKPLHNSYSVYRKSTSQPFYKPYNLISLSFPLIQGKTLYSELRRMRHN